MTETTALEERSAAPAPIKRRDLVEQNFDALDQRRVDSVKVTASAGGVAFASALEVMEFAKLMAMSDKAVPKDFRGNAGMCLAITMQAIEWRMSPFQVANKAYVVNDRIGYESQLIHAVIEARAPLKERLDCVYDGAGPERSCIVHGKFLDGSIRQYTSPLLKDIRVKNSPLWKDDPDQQLWYYASRSWARKWCPDVILGVYSKEEIEEGIDAREPALPGLGSRLVNGSVNRDEGHREGHVESELEQVAAGGQTIQEAQKPAEEAKETPADASKPSEAGGKKGRTRKADKGAAAEKNAEKPAAEAKSAAETVPAEQSKPKNAREWAAYCQAWLKVETDFGAVRKRWDAERQLRNACGVTSEERVPVQNLMIDRCKELGKSQ